MYVLQNNDNGVSTIRIISLCWIEICEPVLWHIYLIYDNIYIYIYIPGPGVRWAFTGPLVLWFVDPEIGIKCDSSSFPWEFECILGRLHLGGQPGYSHCSSNWYSPPLRTSQSNFSESFMGFPRLVLIYPLWLVNTSHPGNFLAIAPATL